MPKSSQNNNDDDPTGLYIDAPTNKWLISKRVGNGACGYVHLLEKVKRDTSVVPTNFVIKLAPLPLASSSNKKKKKSDLEKNADLLYHENTLYRNVLNDLRGTMIPDLPIVGYVGGSSSRNSSDVPPIAFGDIVNYRFLIMEKMEHPLHFLVPSLYENHSTSTATTISVKIGDIAMRLITLVEAMHSTQRLFVDIKPENFMIAFSTTTTPKKKSTAALRHLADRVRMIDFGLVENIKDATNNKHRIDNYPDASLVGTPIYASLNVMNGHTPSRRDDLESIGYVLSELILQIMAYGSTKKKAGGSNGQDDVEMDVLPWSNQGAKSDDEVLKLKQDGMDDKNGTLWKKLMGEKNNKNGNEICSIMKEYFEYIMSLEYKEKPDYEHLKLLCSKLNIVFGITNAKKKSSSETKIASSASASASASTRTTRRRVTRQSTKEAINNIDNQEEEEQDDDDVVIIDHSSSTAITHKRKSRTSAKAATAEALEEASSTSTQEKQIGKSGKSRKKRITKTTVTTTKTIEIIDDDEFADAHEDLQNDYKDSDEEMESVGHDEESDNNNDQNTVDVSFKSCGSMEWQEILSNNENDSCNINDASMPRNEPSATTSALKLECIEGPLKGESVSFSGTMIIGSNPTVGARSKVRPEILKIKDDEVAKSHAKLVLNKSGSKKKTLLTIRVSDLKSSHGTYVNGKKITGSGKQAFVNDKIKVGQSIFCVRQV
mmetsp:Transcript_22375/g.27420  ORF Transcript_22375/g.27420 Transcript_22375/m.27420 type:complete len:716 (+) Transcript_22375:46-2193(+)